MALVDQYTLSQSATFRNKVQIAATVRANAALDTTLSSGELEVVRRVVTDPVGMAAAVTALVVVQSAIAAKAATEASITDAEIQTAVNAVLPKLVR